MERIELETVYPTSLAIREFLLKVGKASPNDFYKVYREYKESTSYLSIARYFWILKKAGLIRVVEHKKGRGRIRKTLYSVVPERIEDDLWNHPQYVFPGYKKRKKS